MTGRDILSFFLIGILFLFYYLFQEPTKGLEKAGQLANNITEKIRDIVRWAERQ